MLSEVLRFQFTYIVHVKFPANTIIFHPSSSILLYSIKIGIFVIAGLCSEAVQVPQAGIDTVAGATVSKPYAESLAGIPRALVDSLSQQLHRRCALTSFVISPQSGGLNFRERTQGKRVY